MPADVYKNARRAPTSIQSGRTLAPGETVLAEHLDLSDGSHDSALVSDGALIAAVLQADPNLRGDALQDRARELDITGRASMTADELREAIAAAEAGATSDDEEDDQ